MFCRFCGKSIPPAEKPGESTKMTPQPAPKGVPAPNTQNTAAPQHTNYGQPSYRPDAYRPNPTVKPGMHNTVPRNPTAKRSVNNTVQTVPGAISVNNYMNMQSPAPVPTAAPKAKKKK